MVETNPPPPDFPPRDVERVALDVAVLVEWLGEACALGRIGQEEFGRRHPQGIEQLSLFELIERLAGSDLDNAAEHVDRMPVIPQRAWLFGQRQLCDPLGKFGIVEIAEIDPVIRGLDRPPRAVEAVGDPRNMQQQILDRDGPAQRHEIEHGLAGLILALDADLHAGERGNVFADGIVEFELSAINQHHRGKAGDGLGQRMQRKDRIRCHVDTGIDIALAEPFEIDRLAVALDQDDGARNFPLRDLIVEKIVDPRKLVDRQHSVRRWAEGASRERKDHPARTAIAAGNVARWLRDADLRENIRRLSHFM